MFKLYNGDCLIESDKIESNSVDLILTDLPYGTIKGLGKSVGKYDKDNHNEWDVVIDAKKIFEISNRILRQFGRILLFAQQPFTTYLINNTCMGIDHNYNNIWLKNSGGNILSSKKAPVNFYEDICVFTKTYDMEYKHPLREYSKQVFNYIGLSQKNIERRLGHRKAEHFFRYSTIQFEPCTQTTYNELIEIFKIDKMVGFLRYDELKKIHKEHIESIKGSTFNLWENKGQKSNVFEYSKDKEQYHPTQKPILLLEDLIKTYSNVGDLVVDFTMGSGSTGVAARNTGRRFIGIEKEKKYFDIAHARINNIIINKVGKDLQITNIKRENNTIEDFL